MRNNQQNFFLDAPSTDFEKVRDGRGSMPLWLDVDLTNARTIAGGSALVLNIAGNSFYIDQDTTNVGTATVHFQDTNLGASSAPLFVSAGFIANVPFTQILIENTAQAGKRLRIFYGVDIDFQAGINASIAISGTVTIGNAIAAKVPMYEAGFDYTGSYKSTTVLSANTPDTVFTPAANVNGAIVWSASILSQAAIANNYNVGLLAKNAAPTTIIDGDLLTSFDFINANNSFSASLKRPVKIAAGKGLYFLAQNAETNGLRTCLYTLL